MAAVLDAMPVGVYVCNGSGTLVFANKTAMRISGVSSLEEMREKAAHPIAPPNLRTLDGKPIPQSFLPMQRALKGEEVVYEMEVFDSETRGTCVLRTRSSPVRDRNGAIIGAVKVAIDVTKEHELARVKDEFIRQAAHELKTPIALIKATAETLASEEQPATTSLAALIRGVDRIDGLVSSLLDLADLEGGLFSFSRYPAQLERVITDAIGRFPINAARRVHVVSTPIVVQIDEARVRRAIYAVVHNAIKYSAPTSTVEVTLTREAKAARIAVRDHGFGIPADKQPHVFEKYFRAHSGTPRDAGGIGVGLFVAREIIRQHGGEIWFESAENHGSVFFIEMPIDEAKTPEAT
ncbi:MAG TPA: PAS domain-containing sensor histidine kinase [Kofleriaceae bacterium]|nr:PAS domain-containing sensor histidine kinase [Kofleriaceae bacterium]